MKFEEALPLLRAGKTIGIKSNYKDVVLGCLKLDEEMRCSFIIKIYDENLKEKARYAERSIDLFSIIVDEWEVIDE